MSCHSDVYEEAQFLIGSAITFIELAKTNPRYDSAVNATKKLKEAVGVSSQNCAAVAEINKQLKPLHKGYVTDKAQHQCVVKAYASLKKEVKSFLLQVNALRMTMH